VEILEKDQTIKNISEVLSKLENEFKGEYRKPKFNKDMQSLLAEITNKIKEVDSLLAELRKTEQLYKEISTKFETKKREFTREHLNDKKELSETREKLTKAIKEQKLLEEALQAARDAIHTLKDVQKEDKDAIDKLDNGYSRLKCSHAEI
jgi:chromosome segregation ATPase